MSEQYTPTTNEVREMYVRADRGVRSREEYESEFNRWLAEVERAAAEKAWDRGCASGYREAHTNVTEKNPYRQEREEQ